MQCVYILLAFICKHFFLHTNLQRGIIRVTRCTWWSTHGGLMYMGSTVLFCQHGAFLSTNRPILYISFVCRPPRANLYSATYKSVCKKLFAYMYTHCSSFSVKRFFTMCGYHKANFARISREVFLNGLIRVSYFAMKICGAVTYRNSS